MPGRFRLFHGFNLNVLAAAFRHLCLIVRRRFLFLVAIAGPAARHQQVEGVHQCREIVRCHLDHLFLRFRFRYQRVEFFFHATACKTLKTIILSTPAFLLVISAGLAQSYSINWYKVAGGGGASTGGVYSVSGTIGQHDAGQPITGGTYSLTGGFWSLIAVVQTPGAPTLYIS